KMLQRYTELCAPASGHGRFAFVSLQQRLLSSPEAFARTLQVHVQAVERRGGPVAHDPNQLAMKLSESEAADVGDPELHGISDEALDANEQREVHEASAQLAT